MAFPRQPLLFTETVPHNSYETVEGNHSGRIVRSKSAIFSFYRPMADGRRQSETLLNPPGPHGGTP